MVRINQYIREAEELFEVNMEGKYKKIKESWFLIDKEEKKQFLKSIESDFKKIRGVLLIVENTNEYYAKMATLILELNKKLKKYTKEHTIRKRIRRKFL